MPTERNHFEGLDESTISFYKGVYEKLYKGDLYTDLEKMCAKSFETKKKIRDMFNIPECGWIKLPDSICVSPSPDEILKSLIGKTDDASIRDTLQKVNDRIPSGNIRSGYIHKKDAQSFLDSINKMWCDEKNNVVSVTKLLSTVVSDKFSQVYSKVYNKQNRIPLYLSVNPMHILMLSDHGDTTDGITKTGMWWSCHNSVEQYAGHEKHAGNVDYMLDNNTFIVFSGNPEYEEYDHYYPRKSGGARKVLKGINPISRTICHVSKDALVVAQPYQEMVYAIEQETLGKYLASLIDLSEHYKGSSYSSLKWSNLSRGGVDVYQSSSGRYWHKNNNEKICIGLHEQEPVKPINWNGVDAETKKKIEEYMANDGAIRDAKLLADIRNNVEIQTLNGDIKVVTIFAIEGEYTHSENRILYLDENGKFCASKKYENLNGYTGKNKEKFIYVVKDEGKNPPKGR